MSWRCLLSHDWEKDVNNYRVSKYHNPEPVEEMQAGVQYQEVKIWKCKRCGKEKER